MRAFIQLGSVLRRLVLRVLRLRTEGKRDTIHLFRANISDRPTADGREVIEARFFALGALPSQISPATLRRIAEVSGERPIHGRW